LGGILVTTKEGAPYPQSSWSQALSTSPKVDHEVMEHHVRASKLSPKPGDERAADTPAPERKKKVRVLDQIQSRALAAVSSFLRLLNTRYYSRHLAF